MDEPRLEVEEPLGEQTRRALADGLRAHFAEEFGDPHFRTVGFVLRDEGGAIVGGVAGRLRWGWLHIETLWVAKHLRGSGQGERLMREVEAYALRHGGIAAHLECGDAVLPFYERLGYESAGFIEVFPAPGERRYFLRKWFGRS